MAIMHSRMDSNFTKTWRVTPAITGGGLSDRQSSVIHCSIILPKFGANVVNDVLVYSCLCSDWSYSQVGRPVLEPMQAILILDRAADRYKQQVYVVRWVSISLLIYWSVTGLTYVITSSSGGHKTSRNIAFDKHYCGIMYAGIECKTKVYL